MTYKITEQELEAVAKIAQKLDFEEVTPGVFKTGQPPHIQKIDCTEESKEFPGMPLIGIDNGTTIFETEHGNTNIEWIMYDIHNALSTIRKNELNTTSTATAYPGKDKPKPKEEPKPNFSIIVPCSACKKELNSSRKEELYGMSIPKKKWLCEDCEEKTVKEKESKHKEVKMTDINDKGLIYTDINKKMQRIGTDLTIESIRKYIHADVSDEEAYSFIQLCIARRLNPFLKDAYIIKYSKASPAVFIVGKDAFLKRADAHPEYEGIEQGIVIETSTGTIERRPGCLVLDGEKLIGGWARIHRKSRIPYYSEVGLKEYIQLKDGQPTRFWKTFPATMIAKVATVQGLRAVFPQEFTGFYDPSEIQEQNLSEN